MSKGTNLKNWTPEGSKIKLTYEDGDVLYVNKPDFDRAFGAIISADKEAIKRDFALKFTS